MEFYINEIKETEQIFKVLYNKSGISEIERKLIEKMFVFLMDRKMITSAALNLEETSKKFVVEKTELGEREQQTQQEFNEWIQDKNIRRKGLFVKFYDGLKIDIRRFVFKTMKFDKRMEIIKLELDELNLILKDANDALKAIANDQGSISTQRFPKSAKKQLECVVKAIDATTEEIPIWNAFIRRIEEKLNCIECAIKHPEEVEEIESIIIASFQQGH